MDAQSSDTLTPGPYTDSCFAYHYIRSGMPVENFWGRCFNFKVQAVFMETIIKIETVAQFNKDRGQRTLHPLVSVLDNAHSIPVQEARCISELYVIFLKDVKCGEFKYGRAHYDYEEGTLLFIAPGQVFGLDGKGTMTTQRMGVGFSP